MYRMDKKIFPLVLLAVISLCQASPVPLHALRVESNRLAPAIIPPGLKAFPTPPAADLDGEPPLETLSLSAGHLEIRSAGETAWQSPADWDVLQAAFTDLDHDGLLEVTLLVWRPFRPWPVDRWLPNGGRIEAFQDAQGYSCQLILIGWREGSYRELWAGSAMSKPVTSFLAADLDSDGRQELLTIESDYAAPRTAPGHVLKTWDWNGFGFSIVSQMGGTFINRLVPTLTNDGRILILVH